jgi:hypothetical protein
MKKIAILFMMLVFIPTLPAAAQDENVSGYDEHEHVYVFLEMTEQEYDTLWKKGKSMVEIAETKGISEQELLRYLLEQEVESMRSALNSGELSHVQYIQHILRLKETLLHKIHGNPHQQTETEQVSNEGK